MARKSRQKEVFILDDDDRDVERHQKLLPVPRTSTTTTTKKQRTVFVPYEERTTTKKGTPKRYEEYDFDEVEQPALVAGRPAMFWVGVGLAVFVGLLFLALIIGVIAYFVASRPRIAMTGDIYSPRLPWIQNYYNDPTDNW